MKKLLGFLVPGLLVYNTTFAGVGIGMFGTKHILHELTGQERGFIHLCYYVIFVL